MVIANMQDDGSSDDDDLPLVLTNIGQGMLASTRANLAKSKETREFLEIGLKILQHDLLMHTGPNFEIRDRSKLFESLSRARIVDQSPNVRESGTKLLTDNMFRHRWDRKDRYTEDLIAYLFRASLQEREMCFIGTEVDALIGTASLGEMIDKISASKLDVMISNPVASLQIILQAALPNHPRVRDFSRDQYDLMMPRWAQLYERIAEAYRLSLNDRYTWLDVALLFHAVLAGAFSRAKIDGGPRHLTSGESVLSGAIFAMLPSILKGLPEDLSSLYAMR